MNLVNQGIRSAANERGGLPSPAEHPFAGSKAPRLRFVGERQGVWTALSTSGEALAGVPESRLDPAVADARTRLLGPNDRCVESDLPGFYGARREQMGVLGAPQAHLTRFLNLGAAGPGTTVIPAGIGYHPYDVTVNRQAIPPYVTADPPEYPAMTSGNPSFPRERFLIEGITVARFSSRQSSVRTVILPQDNLALLETWISAGILNDLRGINALQTPPEIPAHLVMSGPSTPAAYRKGIPVDAIADNPRVWSDDAGRSEYAPGRIRPALDGSGSWRTYRLRGAALYDAWGGEILFQLSGDDAFTLMSAGRDRCFVLVPGMPNGTFATSLAGGYDGTPTAPDRDGTIDNISLDGTR